MSNTCKNFTVMAKVSVIPNPIRSNKDESKSLVVRLSLNGKSKYFSTDIKVLPGQWNDRLKQYKTTFSHLNEGVFNIQAKAQSILNRLEENGTLSFTRFEHEFFGDKKHVNVMSFIEEIINGMKSVGNLGNAKVYGEVLAILRSQYSSTLMFEDMDIAFLRQLESHMRQLGWSGNTIARQFRTLRAIYNRAIGEDYINPKLYPFKNPMNPRGYNVSALEVTPKKRALTEEDFQKILDYKPLSVKEDFAKDVFIISFYLQGISFSDLCRLKYDDIRDGRIIYNRIKTRNKARISVYINKPIQDIINKYLGRDSSYILPILYDYHQTGQQIVNRIHKKLAKVNEGLKAIASNVGININISTYCARHTYATLLKRKGVSTAIISQALGHTSEQTTQWYLDSFENKKVDEANDLLPQ
jgi:integrase/recombinase XerD